MDGIDALLPPDMARKAEEVGVRKGTADAVSLFCLGVLAGAFIAVGALFSSIAVTDPAGLLPWGVGRVLGGLVFSTGLVGVVVGGAELFTGNTLLVMAWASRRLTTVQVLRNWTIVYAGNATGALGTTILVFVARTWDLGGGAVGRTMLDAALGKASIGPGQALAAGVLANALVCLAVWLSFSARSTVDRVVAVILPVAAFVAAGFEHSIANLYVIPMGMLVKTGAPDAFWERIGRAPSDYAGLTLEAFLLGNLLPVTVGNVIGGSVLVGGVYWVVYLRRR